MYFIENIKEDLYKVMEQSFEKDRIIDEPTADLARKTIESLVIDKFHDLVIEQKEELESEQFQPISIESRKGIRDEFKKSKRFKQIYEKATKYLYTPHTDRRLKEFMGRFAGRLNQDTIYNFFVTKQSQSNILLSPERTFEFYKKLYSDKPVIENILGLDSLEGISVPDGIVVKEHEGIVAVCEYTLTGDEQIFGKKYSGFCIGKKHSPQVFADAHLLFVVLNDAYLPKSIIRHAEVKVKRIPFRYEQFRNYVEGVYYHYRPQLDENNVTLSDIQKRVTEQFIRVKKYLEEGKPLTPQYKQYLSKINKRFNII